MSALDLKNNAGPVVYLTCDLGHFNWAERLSHTRLAGPKLSGELPSEK
jgi:hypothetical protein